MRSGLSKRCLWSASMVCAFALTGSQAAVRAAEASGTASVKAAGEAAPGTHRVAAGETMFSISAQYGLKVAELAVANGIAAPYALSIGQVLSVPKSGASGSAAVAPRAFRTHIVEKGDTPFSVAQLYGVSVAELEHANHLSVVSPLNIGAIIAIPVSDVTGAAPPARSPGPRPRTHMVRLGDTPYNIAQRYGITVQELERANGLVPPYSIYLGSVLALPPSATGGAPQLGRTEPAAHLRVHAVRPGDTLYSISRLYGRSVDAIKQLNHLTPPFTLTIGTVLVIPEEAAPPPAVPLVPVPPAPLQPAPPPVSLAPAPKPAETVEAQIPREGPLASAEFNLTAVIRNAFNYKSGQIQTADLRLEPSFAMSLFDGWTLHTKARFIADAEDRLERGRPDQRTRSKINRRLLIGDRAELELREAYLHGQAADIDWTIGKQSIVWGEADSLKVLDIVDPQSYREFILAPYEQSRIPRWSVRAEKRLGDTTLEGVVLFDNTYNEYPPVGSEYDVVSVKLKPVANLIPQLSASQAQALFATLSPLVPFQLPSFPAGLPPIFVEEVERRGAAREPDFGGRIKTFVHGWDLSALYYRHTDLDPSLMTRVSLQGITLTPVYNRVNLFGGTFANAFGNFTVRGELGYTTGRVVAALPDFSRFANFNSQTQADLLNTIASGLLFDTRVKRDNLSFVLGVDYFGFRSTVVSLQFFQDTVMNPPANLLQPKTAYSGTFYVRRTALHEKLTAEFQAVVNFTEGDALIRPKLRYDLRDNLGAYVGADIFLGNTSGIFGSFKDQSRIVTGLEFNM